MARTDSFVEYTVELLEKVGRVQPRRMFGAWGLFLGGRMFGVVDDGQLFLKTDDLTKADFQAAGGRPFTIEMGGKANETGYWTPPADAADDAYALLPWARKAVGAAERAALKKAPKKKAPAKKTEAEKKPRVEKAPARKKVAPVKKAAKTAAPVEKASKKLARKTASRSRRS